MASDVPPQVVARQAADGWYILMEPGDHAPGAWVKTTMTADLEWWR